MKIRPVQISFCEEVRWRCFWVEAPCFSRGRQRFSVAGRNPTSQSCALALGFVSGHGCLAAASSLAAASVSRAVNYEKMMGFSSCWILLTSTLSYPTTTCFPNAARFALAPNGINLVHLSSKLIWTALVENQTRMKILGTHPMPIQSRRDGTIYSPARKCRGGLLSACRNR